MAIAREKPILYLIELMNIITVAEFRKDLPQDMGHNRKHKTLEPVITIRQGSRKKFCHIAKIKGACRNAVGKPKAKS